MVDRPLLGDTLADRSLVRLLLIVVLGQLGVRALMGGSLLVLDASGNQLGYSTAALDPVPVSTFLLPGLVLGLGFGGGSLVVAAALYRRRPGAWIASAVVGGSLGVWVAVEVAVLGFGGPTILLNAATALAALVLSFHPTVRASGELGDR